MHELIHVLPVLRFFADSAVSIVLIRREYWCLLLYVVLLVVNIQVTMRIESALLLSEYNYYVKTPLMVDVLSRFQSDLSNRSVNRLQFPGLFFLFIHLSMNRKLLILMM